MAVAFSLWLIPADEQRTALGELIARLAGRFGSPRFAPHATLCSGQAPAIDRQIADMVGRLCADLRPLPFAADGIGRGDDRFTFLFLRLKPADLAAASVFAHATSLIPATTEPKVGPHLSLMYGEPASGIDRASLAQALAPELPGAVLFDAVQLVRLGEGEWRDVAGWTVAHTERLRR